MSMKFIIESRLTASGEFDITWVSDVTDVIRVNHAWRSHKHLTKPEFLMVFMIILFSARDLTDNEEFSFYEQCLTNLDADLHTSAPLPWANLADVGDTITEFSLNVSTYRGRSHF
jgi:hypothetical protein